MCRIRQIFVLFCVYMWAPLCADMSAKVCPCVPIQSMFVCLFVRLCACVGHCLPMSAFVCLYVPLCVLGCLCAPLCAFLCLCSSTFVCLRVPECACISLCLPITACVCFCVPLCSVCLFVPLGTFLCQSCSLPVFVCLCVPTSICVGLPLPVCASECFYMCLYDGGMVCLGCVGSRVSCLADCIIQNNGSQSQLGLCSPTGVMPGFLGLDWSPHMYRPRAIGPYYAVKY